MGCASSSSTATPVNAIESVTEIGGEPDEEPVLRSLRSLRESQLDRTSLKDQTLPVRVVAVLDGDTIMVAYFLGDSTTHLVEDVRLFGIDAPECRPRRHELAELEADAGRAVKRHVTELLQGKIIDARFLHKEKFGRQLAWVWLDSKPHRATRPLADTLNQQLLEQMLAKPYKGEKKQPWTQEQLEAILDRL